MVIEKGRNFATSRFRNKDSKYLFAEYRQQLIELNISSRFMFRLIKVILIITLCTYTVYYWLNSSIVVEDKNYGEITVEELNSIEIDKMCSNPNLCYSVVDIFHNESPLTVQRAIYVSGFESEYDSVVQLIPPFGVNANESDTRIWKVNHTSLTTQYIAAMVTQMFAVSALSMSDERDDESSVLVIGLGGGNLDMFLHEKRPKISLTVVEIEPIVIHLARKWFQIEDDSKRTTLVMDGINFINQASDEGTKYDVVIIDACDSAKSMPCPAKTFLMQKNLKSIKHILKPMGVFILNVLILEDRQINEKMIEKTLLSQFPTCIKMYMAEEVNAIYSCVNYALEPNTIHETKQLIQKRIIEASTMLGIDTVVHYASIDFIKG